MTNSNQTLRFPRTSKDVYGYQAEFEKRDPDRIVGLIGLVALGFVFGFIVGGM